MQCAVFFRRVSWLSTFIFATFFIASCASGVRTTAPNDRKNAEVSAPNAWTGRISLQVQSPSEGVPAQSFAASFEINGQPERGDLTLIDPLGSVLGVVRWTPEEAVLDSGNGRLQRYASMEAFLAQTTGAAIPLTAFFSWLQGQSADASGWTADLSRHAEGRVTARRIQPAPKADLRLVLNR